LVGGFKAKTRWLFGEKNDATSTLVDKSNCGEIEPQHFFEVTPCQVVLRRLKYLVVGQIICTYKSSRRGHFDISSSSFYAEKQVENWLVQHGFMNMAHLNLRNVVQLKDINLMDEEQ